MEVSQHRSVLNIDRLPLPKVENIAKKRLSANTSQRSTAVNRLNRLQKKVLNTLGSMASESLAVLNIIVSCGFPYDCNRPGAARLLYN